jgi:hypothetical protein
LAVILLVAVGLTLSGPSRPANQNSHPQVAQADTLHKETASAGGGKSASLQPRVASEQPAPAVKAGPYRQAAGVGEGKYVVWVYKSEGGQWVKHPERTWYTDDTSVANAYVAQVKAEEGWTATTNAPEPAVPQAQVAADQQAMTNPTKAAWDQMQQVHIQRSLPSDNSQSPDEFARKIAQQYAQINTDYVDSELCDLIRDWTKLVGESSDLISNYARERSQIQQTAPAVEQAGAEIGSANKENPRGGEVGGAMLGAFLGVVIESGQLNELDKKYMPQAMAIENRRKELLQRQATLGMKLSSKYGLPFKDRLTQ